MKIVQEFKEFILKGNMVDLAVGIVIGAAFSAVVNSLVKDILMPPLGYVLGKVDFSDLTLPIPVPDGEPVEIRYGSFLNALIALLIQGLAIFAVVKVINRIKQEQEKNPEAAPTPVEVELLREIRDELRGGSRAADPGSRVQGSPPGEGVV